MDNQNRVKNCEGVWEISVDEVHASLGKFTMIDVRREEEWHGELGHIQGATLSTLQTDFQCLLADLTPETTYIFVCRSGQRSSVAGAMAIERGIKNVYNMVDGMVAWNEKKFP